MAATFVVLPFTARNADLGALGENESLDDYVASVYIRGINNPSADLVLLESGSDAHWIGSI